MKKDYFINGLKDSSIFGVSFIFLYLSIGANAYANALGIFESIATTLFVYFPHLYNFSLCRVIKRAIIFLSRLYWR